MSRRHSFDDLLAHAVDEASATGLAGLSFGRVARRAGVPDRTVVYYFPSKQALWAAVVDQVTAMLSAQFASVLSVQHRSPAALVAQVWAVLAQPRNDPLVRLYLEGLGLAAARQEPFATIAPGVAQQWLRALAAALAGEESDRQVGAAAALAMLDGLLVVRLLDPRAADQAAGAFTGAPAAARGDAPEGSRPPR